jgi:hypothetical protein
MFEGLSVLFAALMVFVILLSLFVVLVQRLNVGALRAFLYLFGAVLGVMAVVSASLLRGSRIAAVPGSYKVTGVWGYSTLTLHADHTATQEVQFMEYDQPEAPPYKQHPTRHAVVQGRWEERGRDWFDRKLVISSLMGLAPWDQGKVNTDFKCSYGPVMLSGLGIEVDAGADIVYRK